MLVPVLAVLFVLLACNGGRGGSPDADDGGSIGGGSLACADATFDLGTPTATSSGSGLLCVYTTDVEDYDDCTLTRTSASGSGTAPSSVTWTRTGSDADGSRTATPSGSWSAFTNGLNCNTPLGCFNGDYEVQLSFSSLDVCPTDVELELEIN